MNPHEHLSTEKGTSAGADSTKEQAGLTSGALPFVLGSVVLGTIGIFVYEADVHPLTATWFRCAFGLIGLTLWIRLRQQTHHLHLSRASWPWVLAAGILMVLAWVLFFAAIERTSAGVATVLFHIQPLWVMVLGVCWLKESVAKQRIVAVMLAMVGLVLATGMLEHLSLPGNAASQPFPADYWIGVAMCLIGAFLTACVTLIAKQLQAMPTGILAWWQCAVGTIALAAWPMMHGWPAWGVSWAWLAGLGLIHTGLAYSLMFAGMARLSIDRIAVFQFIYPGIAIVIDWLFYEERLGSVQLSGVVLMAVAIWFAERVPKQQRVPQAAPSDTALDPDST
jgi:drug/metabolite transporter (DMT)-like permease